METIILTKTHPPEKKDVRVVLRHRVRLTAEVPESREVKARARGHLQHAAPRLVTQHLHFRRVQQRVLGALVLLVRQVVVQAGRVRLLVDGEHLGVHDDFGEFSTTALAKGSPLGWQLTGKRKAATQSHQKRNAHPSRAS